MAKTIIVMLLLIVLPAKAQEIISAGRPAPKSTDTAKGSRYRKSWGNAWVSDGLTFKNIDSYTPILCSSIGLEHTELLSQRVPIYAKTGVAIQYTYPDKCSMTAPTCFGFGIHTANLTIMPYIGLTWAMNFTPRYYESVTMATNTGCDFMFSNHLYIGSDISVEVLMPHQNAHRPLVQFKIGGTW